MHPHAPSRSSSPNPSHAGPAAHDAPRSVAADGADALRRLLRVHGTARRRVGAGLAAFAAVAGTVAFAPQSALGAVPTAAHDAFHRTVKVGLGHADQGGAYALGYNGADPFHVSPGTGASLRLAPGAASASLMSVHTAAVDLHEVVTLPAFQKSSFTLYAALEARRQANKSAYRGKVSIRHDGHLSVSVSRKNGARETILGNGVVPGALHAGQKLNVELSVTGASPVSLKIRAWTGPAVPTWQLAVVDRSSSRIGAAGGVGMWDYLTGTRTPLVVNVGSFVATPVSLPAPPKPAPPKPAPPKPAPTTSAPAPTTSAPAPSGSASTSSTSSTAPAPSPTTPAAPKPSTATARGSLPVGQASYPVPSGALFVSPSGNDANSGSSTSAPKRTIAAALKAARPGQTIVLRGGSYNESLSVPSTLSGITIQNYPGEAAWLDGSVPVTNWTHSGSTWVSTGWTAQFDHSASFTKGSNAGGFVLPQYPMAAWPDMVFLDGTQLRQVATPADVVAGTFAVDYAQHTLTTGSDPTGHQLRASNRASALVVSATNVTLRGVGVRRYADSLPTGGALYFARNGDAVENVVLSDLATQGISMYKSDAVVNHVTITRAGMLGIMGYHADGSVVENSVITESNSEHFNKAPSSAGIKLDMSLNTTIRNNTISGGYDTHAIWTDGSTIGFTIVGNDMSGNGNSPVVQIEESARGIVADNKVSDGTQGVYVFDTSDVQIYNNTFSHNSIGSVFVSQDERRAVNNGLANPICTWVVQNITVADNEFQYNGPSYGFQFYALDKSTNRPASSMGITIDGNLFHFRSSNTDSMVLWGGTGGKGTHYDTPSALNSALGTGWNNQQVATGALQAATVSGSQYARPLPSDVAAAVGKPAGTKAVGAFH